MSKEFFNPPGCVLYVCCGSKCKKRGSKHIYKRLKSSVKENGLKRQFKIVKTGCTDNCKKGPVIAVMPQNEWHFEVSEEQAMSLITQ